MSLARPPLCLVFTFVVIGCATTGKGSRPGEGVELDVVTLQDGQQLYGKVLVHTEEHLVLGQQYGTFTFPAAEIASVERGRGAGLAGPGTPDGRLPAFANILELTAQRPWAAQLQQVPATVIDEGELRHVPYISHRAGPFELNVYGDPDAPAGVELGTQDLSEEAQAEVVAFMQALMPKEQDRHLVRAVVQRGGRIEATGYTFSVTPPDAPDAYGAWWVSVYSQKALASARASAAELARISRQAPPADVRPPGRPGNGDEVYIRGYHRLDGTYVAPGDDADGD